MSKPSICGGFKKQLLKELDQLMAASGEQRHVQTASKVCDELADVVRESTMTFFTQALDGKYREIITELVRDGRTSLFVAFPVLLTSDEMLANTLKKESSCFEPALIAAAAALGNMLFNEMHSFLPIRDTDQAIDFNNFRRTRPSGAYGATRSGCKRSCARPSPT